jgi:hypothetical protein
MSRSPLQADHHRWRTATKRQILGNFSSKPSSAPVSVDGSNADHVKSLIDELQGKYEQMIAFLKADLDDCKLEQEQALSAGLVRLPKAVRNMSVKEFNQQHSCDLLALLRSKDGVVLTGAGQQATDQSAVNGDAAGKKRDYQMAVVQTPGPRARRQDQPASAVRTARRGEGL